MVHPELEVEFGQVLDEWQALGRSLAELTERLAVETLVDVLPGASVVEVCGEFNEDWLRILRVRRVLAADGAVLFDVAEGHADPRVEQAIDEVNSEYLDLLLDLTGDMYMGRQRSSRVEPATATAMSSKSRPLLRRAVSTLGP